MNAPAGSVASNATKWAVAPGCNLEQVWNCCLQNHEMSQTNPVISRIPKPRLAWGCVLQTAISPAKPTENSSSQTVGGNMQEEYLKEQASIFGYALHSSTSQKIICFGGSNASVPSQFYQNQEAFPTRTVWRDPCECPAQAMFAISLFSSFPGLITSHLAIGITPKKWLRDFDDTQLDFVGLTPWCHLFTCQAQIWPAPCPT